MMRNRKLQVIKNLFKWRKNICLRKVSTSLFRISTEMFWKVMKRWKEIFRQREDKFMSWIAGWIKVMNRYWNCSKNSKSTKNKTNFSTIFSQLLWSKPNQWSNGANFSITAISSYQVPLKLSEKNLWTEEQT